MKTLLIFIAICLGYSATAQNAKEVTTKYNRVDVPAVEATYKNSKEVVETALNDYLIKNFKRKKSSKGYNFYENVSWVEISDQPLSVFTKVSGGKNSSTVTVLISTPSMAFYSSLGNATYIENLKTFLNNFEAQINGAQQVQDVNMQADEVKKIEDKISKNKREASKLQSDKEKLEKDIVNNAKELEELNKKLQEEKNKLEKVKN